MELRVELGWRGVAAARAWGPEGGGRAVVGRWSHRHTRLSAPADHLSRAGDDEGLHGLPWVRVRVRVRVEVWARARARARARAGARARGRGRGRGRGRARGRGRGRVPAMGRCCSAAASPRGHSPSASSLARSGQGSGSGSGSGSGWLLLHPLPPRLKHTRHCHSASMQPCDAAIEYHRVP